MSDVRTYLDHAATTWPKPECVYDATHHFAREIGVAAGRGNHGAARAATDVVEKARLHIAQLIGVSQPRNIALTSGCTASLNMVLHGLLKPGDHVVTTVTEHNSVLRPLHHLKQQGIRVTYVNCDDAGYVNPREILTAAESATRLVVVNHASNVTGAIQRVEEFGPDLHSRGIPLLVDAAQSLGTVDLDVQSLGIALLAAPGHKGLMGPLGTGILYATPEFHEQLQPILQGGTGTESEQEEQPTTWPERMESGSLNTPAIAGLAAGAKYLLGRTVASIRNAHNEQMAAFLDGLLSSGVWTLWGSRSLQDRVAVISITANQLNPHELASLLDSHFGIQTRAGLHCAPRIHKRLGTLTSGGTLRFSLGATSGPHDLQQAMDALQSIEGHCL
ncbi:MAG: aminotransferase class V-fold PLP-dependent enzyme [Planctomycetota bacterium]|nr:aminotransferase class V-fold PLP-dependent enzyme [Planctomycetota bacterium]MDA1180624.1 aminotransferase class V-fold PLP-dependent enzyme [Planctomycetota bacterium]